MEAIAVIFGIGAVGFYVVAPILALVNARQARSEIDRLRTRLDVQDGEIEALRWQLQRLLKEGVQQAAQLPQRAQAPAAQAQPVTAAEPMPPRVELPVPDQPPVVLQPVAVESPVVQSPPAVLSPVVEPPPAVLSPVVEPPAAAPPAAEQPPPPVAPPPDSRPAFDWEKLLGVRGAAWLGAVALVIAGSLFAKYSIENNLIPPAVRVAMILLTAVGCLVGSEFILRGGYGTTANSAAGAGVALLYTAFYVAHGVYKLLPLSATFALMVLTTVVACLLALRHDAMFIAVLGLLGGFATPLSLSSGHDRPIGLFSYILLLDVGFLYIAVRRAWSRLTYLSLAATVLLQLGWASRYLSPEKMPIALGALTAVGLLYLLLPSLAPKEQRGDLTPGAFIGGLYPFGFALMMAGDTDYAAHWPLLFGFTACLSTALIFIGLRRAQTGLLLSGAVATGGTLVLWSAHQLHADNLRGASLTALGLTLLYNLPALLRRHRPALWARLFPEDPAAVPVEIAATLLAGALGLFAAHICAHHLGEPPYVFQGLLLALFLLGLDRAAAATLRAVGALWPLGVALLAQAWFFATATDVHLLRDLALPVLVAAAYAAAASVLALRARATADPSAESRRAATESDIGALLAAGVALMNLFGCLEQSGLGQTPLPLLVALCVLCGLLVLAPLRDDRTWLWPATLLAAVSLCTLWHADHFQREDLSVVAPFYVGLYLTFLLVPQLVPVRLRPAWLARPAPLLASALSGPLFFGVLHRCWVSGLGQGAIGVLPLLFAVLTMLALALVRGRFIGRPDAVPAEAYYVARLRALALLSAVVLGFIAAAIPMQLDRQWITIGWALEAMAVWWLYVRLPHPGLKYLGLLLYLAVALRLLNPWMVLDYPHGLPVLNWILYTYGVAALAFLIGGYYLAPIEEQRLTPRERRTLAPWLRFSRVARLLALILLFSLISLEIVDYFSPGPYVGSHSEDSAASKLTMSIGWGVYAMLLLGIGLWRRARVLRFASMGFMLLTISKVFLYDLSELKGLYRPLSFLGLALSLIMISLLYQRFVFRKEPNS